MQRKHVFVAILSTALLVSAISVSAAEKPDSVFDSLTKLFSPISTVLTQISNRLNSPFDVRVINAASTSPTVFPTPLDVRVANATSGPLQVNVVNTPTPEEHFKIITLLDNQPVVDGTQLTINTAGWRDISIAKPSDGSYGCYWHTSHWTIGGLAALPVADNLHIQNSGFINALPVAGDQFVLQAGSQDPRFPTCNGAVMTVKAYLSR